jgi:hypothetical protein
MHLRFGTHRDDVEASNNDLDTVMFILLERNGLVS